MSDKMRWRYGNTNPVVAAVGSSTVIEIGDLLWQDVNQAKPASDADWASRAPKNISPQEQFADSFLGVAMQRSRAGDTDPVRVATTGVFEFDVDPPDDFELGDLIGAEVVEVTDYGEGLKCQEVVKVSASKYAIGRCAKRGSSLSTVLVDIRSIVSPAG